MPELKLLRIEEGDSQKNLVDKVNSNFSSLITFGGGPYGRIGAKGPRGQKGIKGPQGSFGDLGGRGTIWTIGPTQPGVTGSFPGDWWLDSLNENLVYKLSTSNSWLPQGFSLNGFDLFSVQGPLSTLSGPSSNFGYFFSSTTPIDFTFLMSDNPAVISGTESSPNPLPNPQYSKFVISVNGSDATKNILEFNKAPYVNSPGYNSGTPRFFWDQGATASRGNYGLKYTNGGKTTWDFSSSPLNLRSTSDSIFFKSSGFNTFLNSQSIFTVNATERLDLNFVGGTVNFSSKNFSYGSDLFTISSQFTASSSPVSGFSSDSGFKFSSTNSQTGNIRYVYNAIPNSSASLLKSTQSGGLLFGVFGDGYLYYDKRVNSIQDSQIITETTTSSVSATTVNWTTVVPSVAINIGSGNFYYANNGLDYIISKSPSAAGGERGICLWVPATGGSVNNNSGWLNLIENEEAISFRVHSASQNLESFRFIGLNTSLTQAAPPNNTASTNYSYADLGSGVGASTVDFTLVNITGTGSNGASRRWFRVYYSAWGGNLTLPQCGVLQTYNSTA